jgi:hypothetical protein
MSLRSFNLGAGSGRFAHEEESLVFIGKRLGDLLHLTGIEISFPGFESKVWSLIRMATSVLHLLLTGGWKRSFLRGDAGDPGHSILVPHQFQRTGRHERVVSLLYDRSERYQRVDAPFLGTVT